VFLFTRGWLGKRSSLIAGLSLASSELGTAYCYWDFLQLALMFELMSVDWAAQLRSGRSSRSFAYNR